MNGHLLTADGTLTSDVDRNAIQDALNRGTLLWLDLPDCDADAIDVLGKDFSFHPLAVEDAQHFGQRPKAEDYDGFTYIVAYGAPRDDTGKPQEVHCFYTPKYLVTVHHGAIAAVGSAASALQRHRAEIHDGKLNSLGALYHVLDALTDSMFPYLEQIDDKIDQMQDAIFSRPTTRDLEMIFGMKRDLVTIRRLVTPQRDVLATLLAGTVELPGMTSSKERYFRDVYDHLIRISDLVDGYRDLLSGSMDAYLSMTSNRLNVVMKQLTIIATVFLPLSFLTGFFGQNFGWMVTRLGSLPVFLGLGVGTEVAAVALLFWVARRHGWLRDNSLLIPSSG